MLPVTKKRSEDLIVMKIYVLKNNIELYIVKNHWKYKKIRE